MRNVLVSVTDKSGLDSFLRGLMRFDRLRITATTSTARFLREKGIECTLVEELTGFPEILAGRVKTLHPRVFAGILSRPSQEDRSCLAELEIAEIDFVVVNLYAFEGKLAQGLPEREMVEQIDVGGVALLRAAAKNFERVAVVSRPEQYGEILEAMSAAGGELPLPVRRKLSIEAFRRTASYDASIAAYLAGAAAAEPDETMPAQLTLSLRRQEVLRYGENPHQDAGWYFLGAPLHAGSGAALPVPHFPPFEQLQGKDMSANNIADSFSLVRILRDLPGSACCIIKHNNPCGVALAATSEEAFDRAHGCDPVSAFGGVYGFTGTVSGRLAEKITRDFVEIVLAPDFEPEALDSFRKKKNLRVLRYRFSPAGAAAAFRLKHLEEFGFIVEADREPPADASSFRCVTETAPAEFFASDIAFAWSVVRHLTSNAIFVARDGVSLGFGLGQTSRIASVDQALAQAGAKARGAVLASDAFFPATDNIESAAKAGIAVIVQPGGSIKDDDVIAACNRAGIAMLFTGQRAFRH